jgi:lipopolysaccharide/colanic/teichoic acid biosynthesis glycosyltransferase
MADISDRVPLDESTDDDRARTLHRSNPNVPGAFEREVRIRPEPNADRTTPDDLTPRERSELLCRAANVAIGVTALLLLSPVLLVVAIVVKATSPGPMLYRQTRVGLDRRRGGGGRNSAQTLYDRRGQDLGGRAFTIYKFRTMRLNAEQGSGAVWARAGDPRVTAIGRFLRKTRIDEIPQLLNVIRGEMNIVGPRPERPSLVLRLRQQIPEYPLRHRVKPGITGWAQINHSYDATIEDVRQKVQFDLEYLNRQSLSEDLLIMARTLPVMLLRRGSV